MVVVGVIPEAEVEFEVALGGVALAWLEVVFNGAGLDFAGRGKLFEVEEFLFCAIAKNGNKKKRSTEINFINKNELRDFL